MDLNINTCRKIQLLELVYGAGGGVKDVEKTLVSANFELLSSFFVLVHRCVDGELFDPGRKRHGTGDFSTSALGSFDDFNSGAVDGSMVKCAKADTDFLIHGLKED